jgi:hypothetical protein
MGAAVTTGMAEAQEAEVAEVAERVVAGEVADADAGSLAVAIAGVEAEGEAGDEVAPLLPPLLAIPTMVNEAALLLMQKAYIHICKTSTILHLPQHPGHDRTSRETINLRPRMHDLLKPNANAQSLPPNVPWSRSPRTKAVSFVLAATMGHAISSNGRTFCQVQLPAAPLSRFLPRGHSWSAR